MPVLSEYVDVKINHRNIKYYQDLGYECTKGEICKIHYLDTKMSKDILIHCKCDYCGREFDKTSDNFHTMRQKDCSEIICCNSNKCQKLKREDVMFKRYGVRNNGSLESTKEKRKATIMHKYGVDNAMKSKEIQKKAKATIQEKYGVDNVMQNESIKNKFIDSMKKKYGVEWAMQAESVQNKRDDTFAEKYGCTMRKREGLPVFYENPEIRHKIINTLKERYGVETSLAFANSRMISDTERHIAGLLDVNTSVVIGKYVVDMQLQSDTSILIEYDGSGHELKRKFYSDEYFEQYESKREKYILNNGYKLIRLISHTDILPSDNDILNIINQAINYLKDKNLYKYDLDKMQQIIE